jgi:hypothetical protein
MHGHHTPPPSCRYAIGRASVGDVRSVALCGGVVAELFRHFLKFDFRNGDLRRRYDSVKYCVRRMEDILCVPFLSPFLSLIFPGHQAAEHGVPQMRYGERDHDAQRMH